MVRSGADGCNPAPGTRHPARRAAAPGPLSLPLFSSTLFSGGRSPGRRFAAGSSRERRTLRPSRPRVYLSVREKDEGRRGRRSPLGRDKYLFTALMHAAAVAIRPVNLSEKHNAANYIHSRDARASGERQATRGSPMEPRNLGTSGPRDPRTARKTRRFIAKEDGKCRPKLICTRLAVCMPAHSPSRCVASVGSSSTSTGESRSGGEFEEESGAINCIPLRLRVARCAISLIYKYDCSEV